MTKEQTIEKLKALYTNAVAAMLRADACGDDESAKVMTEYAETLNAAINALETALQTDGDCISRQASIEELDRLRANWNNADYAVDKCISTIKDMPSVQPKERTEECTETHACDCISRQAAIDAINTMFAPTPTQMDMKEDCLEIIKKLSSVQPDNSCDGCKYEDVDDGVLVPCGFCKRTYSDNYERRSDGQTD